MRDDKISEQRILRALGIYTLPYHRAVSNSRCGRPQWRGRR